MNRLRWLPCLLALFWLFMPVGKSSAADDDSASARGIVKSSAVRYGVVAQTFHWVTAVLVLVAFLYGPGGHEERVYPSTHDFDRRVHETLRLCVFALTVARLIWRSADTRPAAPRVSPWMNTAAAIVQLLLYLPLFTLPVTAVAGAWVEGYPLTLLGGDDSGNDSLLARRRDHVACRVSRVCGAVPPLSGFRRHDGMQPASAKARSYTFLTACKILGLNLACISKRRTSSTHYLPFGNSDDDEAYLGGPCPFDLRNGWTGCGRQ